ncbi:helix-turn-helix domain-containing protein [Rhodococcus ruber]|uniref:Helix-turn-helix domain-containing protein n=1 Tax=Rhodococcus ruber TaxID=1830 RepID=A0ABT4M9U2_9NOCA|nr:helix-turn-helix domain-containing protein [Rhodococcus ruber]MCZ4517732.1 helix-turn-helix domain-containing protein [Rhodococcus ruber]
MPDSADSLEASVFARDCASRQTLQNATSRWGVLALAALTEGDYRFNALRRRVDGVSERMLSQTLQTLKRDGLVVRTVRGTIPPKVEYSLTPLGRDVGTRLSDLIELIEGNMPLVLESRTQHDAR